MYTAIAYLCYQADNVRFTTPSLWETSTQLPYNGVTYIELEGNVMFTCDLDCMHWNMLITFTNHYHVIKFVAVSLPYYFGPLSNFLAIPLLILHVNCAIAVTLICPVKQCASQTLVMPYSQVKVTFCTFEQVQTIKFIECVCRKGLTSGTY